MPETVLVIEDDVANAILVETILRTMGDFEVVRTDDGDEVISIISGRKIKAVLMDVSLQNTRVGGIKVDGVELTRRIRELPNGRDLPVILLTAHAMRGDRERFLFSSGANDYVSKPIVDPQGFVDLIHRQIESSDAVRGFAPGE
jgi:two-component system cell cycle response regulator DivK